MNATTYLSRAVLDQLDGAQAVIDTHIVECARCGTNQPCYERIEAERVFLKFGRLPQRHPGMTLAGSDGRPAFGWFRQP